MGITPEDIQAQRELLERGERILKAQEQRAGRARLRDHFAAAALAGLLSRNHAVGEADHCYAAFRWADAMLRERERTNLDAAPAAKAAKGSLARGTDADGTGDTPDSQRTPGQCSTPRERTEPVAFAVVFDSTEQIDCEFIYPDEATAGDVALDSNGSVVPLYRSPTLTDAEREALWFAVAYAQNAGHECEATLRGLLDRLKLPQNAKDQRLPATDSPT